MGIKSKLNLTVILLIIILSLISSIYAITGSIGNARMILRLNEGDKIEKYVLVKNVNDIVVDIELTTDGDLKDYIEIKENKFTLAPKEEKKAYFTIKAAKPDTTESKINVKFIPKDGKNGVGLSSTIIVITKEDGNVLNDFFDLFKNDDKTNENNTVRVGVKGDEDDSKSKNSDKDYEIGKFNINYLMIMLTIITILFLFLLILLFYLKNKRHNKIKGFKINKLKKSVQRK